MSLKQRVEKLEETINPNAFMVCYIPRVSGEDWEARCTRFRLKFGGKKNKVVFLSHPEDLTA
jgi:hypothetical protein